MSDVAEWRARHLRRFVPVALLNPVILVLYLFSGEGSVGVLVVTAIASGVGVGVFATAFVMLPGKASS